MSVVAACFSVRKEHRKRGTGWWRCAPPYPVETITAGQATTGHTIEASLILNDDCSVEEFEYFIAWLPSRIFVDDVCSFRKNVFLIGV